MPVRHVEPAAWATLKRSASGVANMFDRYRDRIVVAEKARAVTGKFLEIVGRYNPQMTPSLIESRLSDDITAVGRATAGMIG